MPWALWGAFHLWPQWAISITIQDSQWQRGAGGRGGQQKHSEVAVGRGSKEAGALRSHPKGLWDPLGPYLEGLRNLGKG